VFDARGNAVQTWVGTNDAGATDSDPTGGGAQGNNMVLVTSFVYDGGQAGGDNNLTQQTQYVDASTARVTSFLYDWRDRQTDTDGEVDFYQKVYYDNRDRVTRTERYNTTLSGNLIARSDTHYDDLIRVYQQVRYEVDPTTGLVGNALTDNTWYDAAGNVLKQQPAGAQLFTKLLYDGVGRTVTQYTGYDLTETSYADAGNVTGDTILEQVETAYDAAGNSIQVTTRQRYHNATGVGPLSSPSSAQPQARVSYTASWTDALGRTAATADYGTNGGSALARPSTIPVRSDTVLVSSTQYDSTGAVQAMTDPAGTVTFFTYDATGREVQRVLNYQPGSSSSSSSGASGTCPASDDTNVTVLTAYNPDGNVARVTAVNRATGNQVTQYIYGSTLSDSGIASSLLKHAEVYPDSVGGSDQVTFAYNRQGEVTAVTDQNGTVHAYDYDLLGRRVQDRVTALGSGVDGAVRRIGTAYEVRGMAAKVTSYDNAIVGSGNVVNEVQLAYNAFAQLTADYQAHAGAVSTGTTPACQYAYATGAATPSGRRR
jgi:YD repeat-containing protein